MVVWAGMVKMTFTLDDTTIETLKRIAKRLQKPQSFILREAICHYEPHAGQLSKAERKQRIALFDQLIATIPSRPASETDSELRKQRLSRRKGWQGRTPSKG
jgi:predicted transcriptional regulator